METLVDTLDNTALLVDGKPVSDKFRDAIKDFCGEDVQLCYQCGECTAGCPVAYSMDISPNQVLRMAQLEMKDEVLSSSSIWLCASCETCATRCPKGVALSKVMDACRQIAVRDGVAPKEPNVLAFHEEFLREVKLFGRIHEISLIGMYKLRSKRFLEDVWQGIQMFLKGKLALIPGRVKGVVEVRKLFRK